MLKNKTILATRHCKKILKQWHLDLHVVHEMLHLAWYRLGGGVVCAVHLYGGKKLLADIYLVVRPRLPLTNEG